MKTRRDFIKDLAICGAGLPLLSSAAHALAPPIAAAVRETIDLGESPWRFAKLDMFPWAKDTDFHDRAWLQVAVPHCFNESDTYQNISQNQAYRGTAWYRRHFTIDSQHAGKRIYLEFQSVDIGAAVYVNGNFMPGNTAVKQYQQVTHVGCFLPFVLDITDDVHFGADNILAVRVSNADQSFFTWPGFGSFLGLGMGFGGIVGPVKLHIVNPVHIPLNVYSPLNTWGTNIGSTHVDESAATLRFQVNVKNASASAQEVVLSTHVLDSEGRIALQLSRRQRIAAGDAFVFDHAGTIEGPHLWYPSNSAYGTPYLYRVVNTIEADGNTVDSVAEYFGIRAITWDGDYGYVNGKKHLLLGFGLRNSYPALGAAVPAELQWRDIELIAQGGGNTLRVGHFPPSLETLAACDAYGVMVIADSGDDEWALHGEPALTYKKEYDREMMVGFRNHPSVAVWESNNGLAKRNAPDFYSPKATEELVDKLDTLQPRIVSSRDTSDYWPTDRRIMIGYTATYKKVPGSPSINMECYSRGAARFDYEHEREFAEFFIKQYNSNIQDSACGWVQWMLAESMESPFMAYYDGRTYQKALGSCSLDGNRLPKLVYPIFRKAIWAPYPAKPGVVLQSHWNYSGVQSVDAWSNCPHVELFLNGESKGVRTPNALSRFTWSGVNFEPGELKAVGLDADNKTLCSDRRQTAGAPRAIRLHVEPRIVKPNGERFRITANGTDVAIVTATIVDAKSVWCPLADQNLHFSVRGQGIYRGSYNFYVDPEELATYHAPGDQDLQAEGGLMRVAVRSTFAPGEVRVMASAAGLESASTSYTTASLRTQS
jgi:hypothetical protein